jgi:hypothetical protein
MCICITQFPFTIYIYIYIYIPLLPYGLCAGCTCAGILALTHTHRTSCPRGSVAQRVDEDKQGAKPPYHSKRLEGLKLASERGSPQALHVEEFLVSQLRGWTSVGALWWGVLFVAWPFRRVTFTV